MTPVKVWPRLLDDGTPALVRMPERGWQPLPADGAEVPYDLYWAVRLRDGDVVKSDPRPAAPADEAAPAEPAPPAEAAPSDPVPADEAAPSIDSEH